MQRNPQNQAKTIMPFGKGKDKDANGIIPSGKASGLAGVCSSCKTEIPAKPGFRPSSLKCPKCGAPAAKK